MVKASRDAASQPMAMNIRPQDRRERVIPSARASAPCTRPAGTGRERVRAILASMSASYHMFSAPEAPAPMAMHSTATPARTG